ncbi:MAG: hypothetical protein Q9181_002800 [Wetmoreana brouardii]
MVLQNEIGFGPGPWTGTRSVDFSKALFTYTPRNFIPQRVRPCPQDTLCPTRKMPVYRNITINLVSQFDILNIPEYALPETSHDPFSEAPALVDKSLVSCYIPIYPLSQFWFSYSIAAPHPPKALYFFKLFINGACVVSWGCGEGNDFNGRTMYGLYYSGERWMGEPGVDVMGFSFASDATTQDSTSNILGRAMEVRVYRARSRKRITPVLEEFKAVAARSNNQNQASKSGGSKAQSKGGISMFNAGALLDDQPQRYYTYSLVDPLDQPFATFRWYYRTWAQLEALGVTIPLGSPVDTRTDPQPPDGVNEDPAKSHSKLASVPSTAETKIGHLGSPGSASDISPLTIRGLSLPAVPFTELSRPGSPSGTSLQRTRSPIFGTRSFTASTPGRFTQLIRQSSRSPSPPKIDDSGRAPSPARIRRTTSMGVLMGAVSNAMRRKRSNGFRTAQEASTGAHPIVAQSKKGVRFQELTTSGGEHNNSHGQEGHDDKNVEKEESRLA